MTNEIEITETGQATIDIGRGRWAEEFKDDLRMIANLHGFQFGWERDDAYEMMSAIRTARSASERRLADRWDDGFEVGGLA